MTRLAGLCRATGRYAEAEALFLQAIGIYRKARMERDNDYATALNNLAGMYRLMGRYGEAERLFNEAIEITRVARGTRHTDYAQR